MRTHAVPAMCVLAALVAACGSTAGERPDDGRPASAAPAAWAPIDASLGNPAAPDDAEAFRKAVEVGLAPPTVPRLGDARDLGAVELDGARMRLLLAPAEVGGWCLGLAGESLPGVVQVSPSCVLDDGDEPALAVATLGGPQPAWMSRDGGTVVYGRARSDAVTVEIGLSDNTIVGGGPPPGGTFAMGPFERGRTPRFIVARDADRGELARVDLWSEADEEAIVGLAQEEDAREVPFRCLTTSHPLTRPSGSSYGAASFLIWDATQASGPDPILMPVPSGGLLLAGTLPADARQIEVRFAASSERHAPTSTRCYVVGFDAERVERDGLPVTVVVLDEDGAELASSAVRQTWLDFRPLP